MNTAFPMLVPSTINNVDPQGSRFMSSITLKFGTSFTTPTARYPIDRLPWTCHASILVRPVPPGISLMCPTHTLSHRFPSAYLPSPAGISRLFHAAPQHRHRRGPKNIKVHALHRTKARHVRRHTWIMLFNRSQAVTITALASIPALPGIL